MIDVHDDYDDPQVPIGLSSPQAMQALDRLGEHVPPDVTIGRPMMAIYDPADHAVKFVTKNGVFSSHSASADRLSSVAGQWAELTEWCGRRETSRTMRRIADLRRPPTVE
jgi:hypothetical protein